MESKGFLAQKDRDTLFLVFPDGPGGQGSAYLLAHGIYEFVVVLGALEFSEEEFHALDRI
jgi:hypothetical protein